MLISGDRMQGMPGLIRQLVPGPWSASSSPAATQHSEAEPVEAGLFEGTVHNPHPNRHQLPDDYSIEDANADFFN